MFRSTLQSRSLNRTLIALLLTAGASAGLAAAQQPIGRPGDPGVVAPTGIDALPKLPADQLDTLVGSIALYPDPLIAQILPASTYPIDIVRAARLIRSGATLDQLDQQSWDPSVRALAHYPSIVQMMDDSIDWTEQLGQAFIAQPDDVMLAVQRLRAKAQSLGNLASTEQQQVLVEDDALRILPANPDIIYVPTYQPAVVYYQPVPLYTSYISFGYGFPCGLWLNLDCDWRNHWCYRPGWSWNHWHDNFSIDHGHYLHARHDFEPRFGDRDHSSNWHRDNARPFTFPNQRLSHGDNFDRFRDRANGGNPDRNRADNTSRDLSRDHSSDRDSNRTRDTGPRTPATPATPAIPPADHTQRGLTHNSSDIPNNSGATGGFTNHNSGGPARNSNSSSTFTPGGFTATHNSATIDPAPPTTMPIPPKFRNPAPITPAPTPTPIAAPPTHTIAPTTKPILSTPAPITPAPRHIEAPTITAPAPISRPIASQPAPVHISTPAPAPSPKSAPTASPAQSSDRDDNTKRGLRH